MVVEDMSISPWGRQPLSWSSSHSQPSVLGARVAVWPGWSDAMEVSRQKRWWAYCAGTWIAEFDAWAVPNMVPVSAFSGGPASDGGLNRVSRQSPVQSWLGSIFRPAFDSL